jgi:hypothetical protein
MNKEDIEAIQIHDLEDDEKIAITFDDDSTTYHNIPKHLTTNRLFLKEMEGVRKQAIQIIDAYIHKYNQLNLDCEYIRKMI